MRFVRMRKRKKKKQVKKGKRKGKKEKITKMKEEKKEEREADEKEEDSSKGVEKEVASLARLCGYSAGHMKELSQCALFFQKFSEEQDKITFGRNRNQQQNDISSPDAGNNVDHPDIDEEEEVDISDLDVDDISIEEDNDDCDISAEAMADIEAEMMNSSIIMAPTSEEENTSKESNLAPEKNVEKVSNILEKEVQEVVNNAVLDALTEVGIEGLCEADETEDIEVVEMVENVEEEEDGESSAAGDVLGLQRKEKGKDVESKGKSKSMQNAGQKVEEMVKLYVDRLVERAEVEARTQMTRDKRESISTHPSPFNNLHEAASALSSDEVNEERRVQEEQLSNILEVMQQNPDMFGRMSEDEINKQVNLYCI
uniref:myb-like protein X isoform X2 n=1 Tax=Ciona intestinalis TaxID=7719 RepID=UPI00089DC476|nr:myb-like protein X isoform X2 [Ciona intestinalis]|eukprot:XP_018669494.1 myb-like protein X isoform X2 [Ciona intestinalis]